MKADTPNLIKFNELKLLLGRPSFIVIGVLEALWLATAKSSRLGDIGRHTNRQIASILEWDGEPDALIEALVESRWLEAIDGPARLVVHDWYHNAPQYIVQWINRHLGFSAEDTKTKAGKDRAYAKWGEAVGLNMCAACIEQETHMQNGPQVGIAGARTQPSPAQPSPPPPPSSWPAVGPVDAEWAEAEAALLSEGVARASEAIRTAHSNGVPVAQVFRVLDHYRMRKPAWKPGALFERVTLLRLNQDPADLWPEPSKSADLESRSAKRSQDQAALEERKARAKAEKAADDARWKALEKKHAADLKALTVDGARRIVLEHFKAESGALLPRLKKPWPDTVKTCLIEYFDQLAAPSPLGTEKR